MQEGQRSAPSKGLLCQESLRNFCGQETALERAGSHSPPIFPASAGPARGFAAAWPSLTPKLLGMNKSQTPTKTFPKGCPLSLWHEYHLVERQLLRRPLGATRSDAVGMVPSALSFHTSPRDSGVYTSLTITVRRDKRMATEGAIEALQGARE